MIPISLRLIIVKRTSTWWTLSCDPWKVMTSSNVRYVDAGSASSQWKVKVKKRVSTSYVIVSKPGNLKKRKEIHWYIKCESIWEYFSYSIIHVLLLLSSFIMFFMKKHTYRSHRNLEQAIINNLQRGEWIDKQISSCALAFIHSFAHSLLHT